MIDEAALRGRVRMGITANWIRLATKFAAWGAICALGACASAPEPPRFVQPVEPVPVPVLRPVLEPLPVAHIPPEPATPIALVVSHSATVYRGVEDALLARMDRPVYVYRLDTSSVTEVQEAIAEKSFSTVVALGDPAFAAVEDSNTDVIHAQIFRASEDRQRGVSAVPPFELQLAFWQSLNPDLKRVGVIAGPTMQSFVAQLTTAAKTLNMEVVNSEVKSDREMLFEFRRMTQRIDGFIFLPDNTVLSPYVIRRVAHHAQVNKKQMLTYSAAIFSLGAFLYITPSHDEVAAHIETLLNNTDTGIQPLNRMRARVQGLEGYTDVAGR